MAVEWLSQQEGAPSERASGSRKHLDGEGNRPCPPEARRARGCGPPRKSPSEGHREGDLPRSQPIGDRDVRPRAPTSASPNMKMSHSLPFPQLRERWGARRGSEEASLWGRDQSGQGDVDRAAAALPGSPCPGRGAQPLPQTPRGKFLRKVKAVLARPPEIPDVWALTWEGPENNVGALVAGRMLCGQRGLQARCPGSSPQPGTPAAGLTLNPGRRRWLPWLCPKPGPRVVPRRFTSPATLGAKGWQRPPRRGVTRVGRINLGSSPDPAHLPVAWPGAPHRPILMPSCDISTVRRRWLALSVGTLACVTSLSPSPRPRDTRPSVTLPTRKARPRALEPQQVSGLGSELGRV